MQVRFRSRLVVPFALAFALGALITGQAHAQVPGYAIKSAKTVVYSGQVNDSGDFGSDLAIAGTLSSNPSLVNFNGANGQVVGSLIRAIVRAYPPQFNAQGSGQAQATANVKIAVKITNPFARPSKVSFTMGTYGQECGTLGLYGPSSCSYSVGSQHGGLVDGLVGMVGTPGTSSTKSPSESEGPELSDEADCFYDADGDYVFVVNLTNTVQAGGQYQRNDLYNSNVTVYARGINCSYLKKVDGQVWGLGTPDLLSQVYSDGNGVYNE